MTVLFGLIVCVAGFVGVVFNRRLSESMMKFQYEDKRARMFVVGRIAYVLIGVWMIVVSLRVIPSELLTMN